MILFIFLNIVSFYQSDEFSGTYITSIKKIHLATTIVSITNATESRGYCILPKVLK